MLRGFIGNLILRASPLSAIVDDKTAAADQ